MKTGSNTTTHGVAKPPPASAALAFKVSGKIGVVFTDNQGKRQSGSAFFAWVQKDKRFAIDLTGALGIGKTYIEGTPTYARLVSQKTGEIVGDSPEDILYQASKWHAPISMLPKWMMAQPSDHHQHTAYDQLNRLKTTAEANWTAQFSYRHHNRLPYKIRMQDDQNNKVVIMVQTRE